MLHTAAYEGYNNIAKVLVSMGANVNSRDNDGLTAIDFAIGNVNFDIVELLLPYVSDINAKEKHNLTLLHKAAFSKKMAGGRNSDKNIEVAKLLISKGADINAQNSHKATPLDMAKQAGDTAMIQYLSDVIAEKQKAEIDEILEKYADALRDNPNDAKAYKSRGFEFYGKGYFDQAIEDSERAIEICTQSIQLNPDDIELYMDRGLAYTQKAEVIRLKNNNRTPMQEDDKAIEDFSHVIKLSPDDALAYRFRGMAYSVKMEYEKAIADHSEAIKLKPDYLDYWFRASACRELGQNEQAKRDLEKVLDLNPDNNEIISLAKNMLNEINKEEQERQEQERRQKERARQVKLKKIKIIVTSSLIAAAIITVAGLIAYHSQENSVVISHGVTAIKDGGFSRKRLVDVDIPDGVITIGNRAFRKNKLSSIDIPDSVTSIGESAFAENRLTSITIGSNVAFTDGAFDNGFENAYAVNGMGAGTYTRPNTKKNSVWTVWYDNFRYRNNEGNITITGYNGGGGELEIPDEINENPVTAIGENVFRNKQITSVAIGNSVSSIGANAFAGNQITSIRIPANVTLGSSGDDGILGRGTGFNGAYGNNGRRAGMYTRPNTNSTQWTRR
uniref:Cell surface protein n=1 Tax=uncultured bacterium contig00032 TaxID=1181521 RepID=A0A806JY28_9BACT|nr:cell surface protein [uncultured bacterium contig00032]